MENSFKNKDIKILIPDIYFYSPSEIKLIRQSINCDRTTFAEIIGVTKTAVKSWEMGFSVPSGTTCRLLSLIEKKRFCFIKNDLKLMGYNND